MLKSGNDAAIALAIHVGGSVQGFADLMNQKAQELGLKNTHFVTPHGLDQDKHYTTAYELAFLADFALNNKEFAKIVNTKDHTITLNGYPKAINNTNELLGYLQGVNGVKTGFTNRAGRCLVTSVNRDNFEIITVVLGADTKKMRTTDSIKLIEYAYKTFTTLNVEEKIKEKFQEWKSINEHRIIVNKGKEEKVSLELQKMQYPKIAAKKEEIDNIQIEVNTIYYMEAPIEKGRTLGNAKIKLGEETLEVVDLKTSESIQKKDIWDYFYEFFRFSY